MLNRQAAEEQGKKLGLLIVSLKITDNEREAMLALLPHMSEQQLEDFINALEINYLQAMTQEMDEKLSKDLEKVDEQFSVTISQINANTNKALNSFVI